MKCRFSMARQILQTLHSDSLSPTVVQVELANCFSKSLSGPFARQPALFKYILLEPEKSTNDYFKTKIKQ